MLVDETGAVRERMSFDAHGSRRTAAGANRWWTLITNYSGTNTTRGYTGHEHVDTAGIVHMNRRLYDPLLGRMLSADPIVQEPHNAQNLNRYSYVVNNPLSYTDPSGLSFWKKYGATIAGIAINAFLPGAGWFSSLFGEGLVGKMVAGFISGAVSNGSLKGGLWGAFSAGVFHGIGKGFDKLAAANKGSSGLIAGLKPDQFAAKVLTHAAMGGVMSQLQGGKFGHGFISAGVVEALSPQIMRAKGGPAQVVVGALVGGTASAASGGKFGNGALTAAFQIAFNHGPQFREKDLNSSDGYESDLSFKMEGSFGHKVGAQIEIGSDGSANLEYGATLGPTRVAAERQSGGDWVYEGEVIVGLQIGSFVSIGPGVQVASNGQITLFAGGGVGLGNTEFGGRQNITLDVPAYKRNLDRAWTPYIDVKEGKMDSILPTFLAELFGRTSPGD